MFIVAKYIEASGSRGQDRAQVIEHRDGLIIVLADGAGGTSGGAEAADTVVLWAQAYATRTDDIRPAAQWAELLAKADQQISINNGQTTGVIVALFEGGISGASVGDSAARIVHPDNGYTHLTANQIHKPLIGTGVARPVPFEHAALSGTLLVASDGLVKYAPHPRLCEAAKGEDLDAAPKRLVDLTRLKSGSLQDDVAVVLCRRASDRRNRNRPRDESAIRLGWMANSWKKAMGSNNSW